ncbi:MAG: hypothetical protein Q7U05_03730 [Polaromonas sp.]|nr:hypothetical protein [Polaromonas sp.]
MALKKFSVYFARPANKAEGTTFAELLQNAFNLHGEHLPSANVEGERYQIRSLQKVGTVWLGTFARLRDDAPNYVNGQNVEQEIQLEDGAAVIEKCYFQYRTLNEVVVWQLQKTAGSLNRAQIYLSEVLGQPIFLPQLMNNEELENLLANNVYEIDFAYARPPALPDGVSQWSRRAFDIMSDVHAAFAKFTLRADRGGFLANASKDIVRTMSGGNGFKKIKIRLTSDSDPVKLFLAPLRDEFTIEFLGRYAPAALVYQGLEDAYVRQEPFIPVGNGAQP